MTTPLLDLGPSILDIKFQKGSTFSPVFFYLAPDFSVIDLTGYAAKMQAKIARADTAPLTGWDLTTANGGLLIVQGDAELEDGTVVVDAFGVQVQVDATTTAAVTWTKAYYDIDLVNGAINTPFLSGRLYSSPEVTP